MCRRRHQEGQLIKTKSGWSVRFYEPGEGHRRRVQTWLGDFKQLPNETAATNAMDAVLITVNQNPTANPQTDTITFATYAEQWIADCATRKLKRVKPSTLLNWRGILDNWLLPMIGDVPLANVKNKTLKAVVERLDERGLSPATIQNIVLVVKLVRIFPTDDDGDALFPIEWKAKVIDAPEVDKRKQHTPCFTSEEVTAIVQAANGRMQMVAILLAASGLRVGELFGLECRHFDGTSVEVKQAIWGGSGKVQAPKTKNAYRFVDLHPDVAALLKQYIGDRRQGFILQTRSGRPLNQANILLREFHPLLESLGIALCGFHAFRRFRNTFMRQQRCPDSLLKFWMGHSAKGMSDLYDKSKKDLAYRRDVVKSMGVGFEIPLTLTPLIGRSGRQEEPMQEELTAVD
jgi:integrase